MALYQLMKVDRYDNEVQSGKTQPSLKRLKTRLSKMRRGYINLLRADMSKQLICARGYSKEAMRAIASCGVETI